MKHRDRTKFFFIMLCILVMISTHILLHGMRFKFIKTAKPNLTAIEYILYYSK